MRYRVRVERTTIQCADVEVEVSDDLSEDDALEAAADKAKRLANQQVDGDEPDEDIGRLDWELESDAVDDVVGEPEEV